MAEQKNCGNARSNKGFAEMRETILVVLGSALVSRGRIMGGRRTQKGS
jgi:hypothetical protein